MSIDDQIDAVNEAADLSHADIFSDAMGTEAAPETVTTEEPAKTDDAAAADTLRDEKGRFAAKTEAEQVEQTAADKTAADDGDKDGQVPSWRMREINAEKREALKALEAERAERARDRAQLEQLQRQIAQQKPADQPKETKPDPLLDPEGYEKYIEQKLESRFLTERRETSLRLASRNYKDEFPEAYKAAQVAIANGDPALNARMQRSADPGETLIEWHREQKTMKEVGNDPNVFFQKRLDAYLADPANLAKVIEQARGVASTTVNTNGTARPAVNLPPSLSSTTRADSSHASADDNDLSDEGLFNHALR